MDKKEKLKSIQKKELLVQKPSGCFTQAERHQIIQEMIASGCTKQYIWEKYTGYPDEHGQILKWMRNLGYLDNIKTRRPNFGLKYIDMATHENGNDLEAEKFENLKLKKRLEELEEKLKDAEMKSVALSTMVDIAEKELKISIRKKFNTKPLKK
jgi:hypothetical protein